MVEVADSEPFFHNNVIDNVEDAVAFYNSPEFNDNPANNPNPPNPDDVGRQNAAEIDLNNNEVNDVANFLRVINALENIRSSKEFEEKAKNGGNNEATQILNIALNEIDDAIEVLDEKGLHDQPAEGDAVEHLEEADSLTETAIGTNSSSARNALIDDAIEELDLARIEMCTAGSDIVLCP